MSHDPGSRHSAREIVRILHEAIASDSATEGWC